MIIQHGSVAVSTGQWRTSRPSLYTESQREVGSERDTRAWPSLTSEKGPRNVVQGSDVERRKALERRRAELDAAHLALGGGARLDDLHSDRLLLVGHLQLAAAHWVPVMRKTSVLV